MKILITGADGFVGKNLQLHLAARKNVQIISFTRREPAEQLADLLDEVDFVFHLAGVNRTQDSQEFTAVNLDLTRSLCQSARRVAENSGKRVPIVYASSIQACLNNLYGLSKHGAEEALKELMFTHQVPVYIFRLPNVFGKWCKPNYNSAVATFCYNVARNLPIQIHDPKSPIRLVYIDDVIEHFVNLMDGSKANFDEEGFALVSPQYVTTVGELAQLIQAFNDSRRTLMTERVGDGLIRALYATYVSYLPVEGFTYSLPQYVDTRGVFVEVLKTPDCGQFSFFTAPPGITRGGHYHHTKTEKFLVIKGQACFRFRHMHTGETHELMTSGGKPQIVETVPGWTHDITNIGSVEMVVMLWANEVFDRAKPDTFVSPL